MNGGKFDWTEVHPFATSVKGAKSIPGTFLESTSGKYLLKAASEEWGKTKSAAFRHR